MIVRSERTREFELRIFIITILVFGSLLVMTTGLGQDQLTPVIGFFGTIAGYVLGGGKLGDHATNSANERPNDRA
jgi:hydrogenase/urease accessory protein HupE